MVQKRGFFPQLRGENHPFDGRCGARSGTWSSATACVRRAPAGPTPLGRWATWVATNDHRKQCLMYKRVRIPSRQEMFIRMVANNLHQICGHVLAQANINNRDLRPPIEGHLPLILARQRRMWGVDGSLVTCCIPGRVSHSTRGGVYDGEVTTVFERHGCSKRVTGNMTRSLNRTPLYSNAGVKSAVMASQVVTWVNEVKKQETGLNVHDSDHTPHLAGDPAFTHIVMRMS